MDASARMWWVGLAASVVLVVELGAGAVEDTFGAADIEAVAVELGLGVGSFSVEVLCQEQQVLRQ